MTTELDRAVAVVNDRARSIVHAQRERGFELSVRGFGALLLSGLDLDPRRVEDAAVREIALLLDHAGVDDDLGEVPVELLVQLWMRGISTGAQLILARRASSAAGTPALPECGQVWEANRPPRLRAQQRRRVRIVTVGFEAEEDYVVGAVVRGEGALRAQRVRLRVAELREDWTLVTEGPSAARAASP